MRLPSAIAVLTLFAAAFAADAAPLLSPHQVDIPLANGILHAQLYKPEGDGPFPVVIALHGCGGVARRSQPGPAGARAWGAQLLKDGNAGPPPGRYGWRGPRPPCPVEGQERPPPARR